MTRAWLILADILVTLLLLVSFFLFYLYPPKPDTITVAYEENISRPAAVVPLANPKREQQLHEQSFNPDDTVMTQKEFLRMAEEEMNRVVAKRFLYDPYLDDTLEKRVQAVSAKEGDAVFIRIFKEEALLEVWIEKEESYVHLKDYRICAYSGELGPKEREGDMQSPEGFYSVKRAHLNPKSKFHLSFNLGYPNAYDRAHERTGSFLMVHGNCVSAGCYAMTDEKIEEIYGLVRSALYNGQKSVPVHIYPFKMSEEKMAGHSQNRWYDFWTELKEGYDYFESEHRPPRVRVENKHYIFLEAE